MGLLDSLSEFASSDQGLGLAQGLLSARGSQGLSAGLAGMQRAKQMQLENEMKRQAMESQALQMQAAQLQLMNARRDASRSERIYALAPQFNVSTELADALSQGPSSPDNPVQQVSPGFNWDGYANAVTAIDPKQGLAYRQALAKESPFNKMDAKDYTPESIARFMQTKNQADLRVQSKLHFATNGTAIEGLNQFTGEKVSSLPMNGNPATDLMLPDGKGGYVPNTPLVGVKQSISKAGAPSTSVKIENKMGEGVAAQVGPMLKESYTAANGAAQQVDAAARIIKAVDTGKLITGPMANTRLTVAQVAQTLGVGGKDDAEKIANTRQAIRGLAEMTLQGRKQMTGQGAVTESEGALAERANSGDISLTAAELKQLAKASARSAQFIYGQHNDMVNNLSADPNTAGLAKFYKPLPMPQIDMGTLMPDQPKSGRVIDFGSLPNGR